MQLGDLRFETATDDAREGRIFVTTSSSQRLFRVDLTRFASAIESEIEAHPIEGESGLPAVIKSATKELRDAYDIHLLEQLRAMLSPNLQAHLQDTVLANEIDSDTISGRIKRIDVDLCRLELKPILPPDVYSPLEEAKSTPLRDALKELYEEWL